MKQRNKNRRKYGYQPTINTESTRSTEGEFEAIAMDNFNNDTNMNKTFVLYREGFCEGEDGTSMIPVNTITRGSMLEMDIDGISDILPKKFQLNHIISRCPQKYHFMKWKCLYSLLQDGCSMQTFYGNTQNMQQSIMIIRDHTDNIFGAFLDSKWRAEYHHYTGSRECFVYKFAFETNEYSIFEYHSTGDKPYFVQSDYDGITIGAGECPAIYIQNNLLMGRTTKSQTFQSDPLSSNSIFQIKNIEIWCPFFE